MSLTIIVACGSPVYKNPDFDQAKERHKIVAILPFTLTTDCSVLAGKLEVDRADSLQNIVSHLYQKELYHQFLAREEKEEFSIIFQDVEETNAILEKSNIAVNDVPNLEKEVLAGVLGVDAVISTSVPCPERTWICGGVVVPLGFLVEAIFSHKRIVATMEIYDGIDGQLLWQYEYRSSKSYPLPPKPLVSSLMKSVLRNFPYKAAR
jgi:hypothetical protein